MAHCQTGFVPPLVYSLHISLCYYLSSKHPPPNIVATIAMFYTTHFSFSLFGTLVGSRYFSLLAGLKGGGYTPTNVQHEEEVIHTITDTEVRYCYY